MLEMWIKITFTWAMYECGSCLEGGKSGEKKS